MRPGDVIDDRFELLRVAGRGGAGIVYEGLDRQSGDRVAIKAAQIGDDQGRFEREIATLAGLRHPAIVTYRCRGSVGEDPYLVMEWLDGEDLGARLKASGVGIDEAVGIARQVAGALAAAHEKGIIHRDVKPSNVFLIDREPERVKLLDFGLARRAGATALTATGVLIGTPSYMAPEQARGGRELDARVDVYGLGATLFHAISGRVPFQGDTVEHVIARIVSEPAPRLRTLVPTVSAALDALVSRMLSKDPSRRPADGRAAQAALVGLEPNAHTEGALDIRDDATVDAGSVATVPTVTLDQRAAGDVVGPGIAASSIAVLPFLDMSPERDQGYLCEGIAEELIDALSNVLGLRVAARISTSSYKSVAVDARELGTKLGVDTILEGGVRLAGQRLRVTVQLVDVATGYPRWSHRFDGTLEDVFAIQDEISSRVAMTLRGMLSSREQDAMRRPGTNVQAYGYFLRGRQLLHNVSPASYELAVQVFERAIEVDPTYVPAYAGLAEMHCRYFQWSDADNAVREAAERVSLRALELGPHLAESHIARGHVHGAFQRYDDGVREFAEAIRINPNSFDAHHLYARMCFSMGRFEDSAAQFRKAAELRPDDYQCSFLLAQSLRRLGRTDEARQPRSEGIHRIERHLQLWPNDARALSLGAAEIVHHGDVERAIAWAHRAASAAPDDPGVWYNVACTYAGLGMTEEALSWLTKTFERGMGAHEWAKRDPDLDGLRDDPRFQALLAKLTS